MRFVLNTLACLTVLLGVFSFAPNESFARGAVPQKESAGQDEKQKPVADAATVKARFSVSGDRGIIQFTFNSPMVDASAADAGSPMPPENMPLVLTPPLEGEARWVNDKTLVFVSYKALPKATRITAGPKPGLTTLAGKKVAPTTFSFIPHPLSFNAEQVRYAEDGTVTIELLFSCAIDSAKLKQALIVTQGAEKKKLDFTLEGISPDNTRRYRLFIKPEPLGEITVLLPEGFTSEEGPEGLTAKNAARSVQTTSMFAINTVRARQSSSPPWERYIEIRTTNSADMDKIKQYMEITPATDVNIEALSNGFRITGDFITKPRVRLSIKKGAPGVLGFLTEDFTSTVVFDDFAPRMAFDAKGSILSPNRSTRVPFSSVNVERVQATLWQLPENNIPLMAMGFFDSYTKHLSRKIAVRSGALNAVRNRSHESALDLAQLAGKAKGVFLLTVVDAGDPKKIINDEPSARYGDYGDSGYYNEDVAAPMEKLVVVSDIGITARVMPDSITVWANSIATVEALRGARVRVFTANNILLAEGRTDADGLWRYQRTEDWTGRERPAIVVVSTGSAGAKQEKTEPGLAEASVTDISFVKLESNLAADSAFDTGGRDYVRQGYEAYCFTPRGIFRPGETVDFKVLVRNAKMRAPERFPVEWRVRSSTGRVVGKGTAMLGAEGGAAFSLPLVASAPTGRYSMLVSLPGDSGKVLGHCVFAVEDFQPPRIEVALTPEKTLYVAEGSVAVDVDAKYLFGSPVAQAPWEGSVNVTARVFSHPDWRAFTFPSRFSGNPPQPRQDLGGTLDAEGKARIEIAADAGWTAPCMNVAASVRVREDGGRWVARTVIVPYFTAKTLLGYEFDQTNEPQAGAPYSMRLAAVTPEGKAVEGSLTATVSKRETYYARSDKGYTQAVRYVPVAEKRVSLSEGAGVLTFTPPQRGEYAIDVSTADGSAAMQTRFSVWGGIAGSEEGGSPLVDRVMLSWDKKEYQLGETAILSVRSPFPGKMLVVLEAEKELFRLTLPLKETETTVRIPVLTGMLPNAYCSAWVIRPVREGEVWGAHRAYGVIPLAIDRSSAKLQVSVTAPEKTNPAGGMPVTVRLADSYGQPVKGEVTLAFVDEGLLSLTSFATPNAFAFFTAKRAMLSMAFDLYDNLMPLTARKAVTLLAGGGAAGLDASLISPMARNLELLSLFVGSLRTDENGVAQTVLNLPEYSGRGRLMAVAATDTALGSTDTTVRVARDVVVEATAPRMVAPGDTFFVPLIAFGDGTKTTQASVTVTTEGPLAIEGPKSFTATLDAKAARVPFTLSVRAGEAGGMAALRIVTSIAGAKGDPFMQRIEVPVRPPFPRLTKSGGGAVKAGEKTVIDIGGGFFPGTQRVSLSFSGTPGVSLMKALDYLTQYPYGCLEQTTSAAWPYLAVPAMLKSLDPEKAKDTEFRQAVDFAVRRILAMQRSDGGFNAWPGMNASEASPWPTVYAAHFLTEAKATGLVPEDALNAALGWMRSYLSSPLPQQAHAVMDALSVKAYVCYVLALNGNAPLGWMQFLQDQGKFLSQSARIFLAGAYATATGKTDALAALGTLPFPRTERYGWSLETAPRNESLRLLMWSRANAFAPETALLAKRVIAEGDKNLWQSTQENAMAVLAVGSYMEKTAGKSQEFTATLSTLPESGGSPQKIASFTDKDNPTFTRGALPPALPAPPLPMGLDVKGEGTAFYSWTSSGVPLAAPEPFNEGISLYRRWTLPDGTVYDFIPDKTGKLPEALRTLMIPHGTRVTVSLYVKPEAAMNSLILADVVPGGFEIDNPNLEPESEYAARAGTFLNPETGKPFDPPAGFKGAVSLNTYSGGRSEMRDDRLLLFVDRMPGRASVFTYTLRAVNKGNFLLPPVSAEDMYDPTVRALTPSAAVRVE